MLRPETGEMMMDRKGMPVLFIGILLTAMEIWKQCYLYFVYFGGQYNVWYFPFQLCSMPMYLTMLYGLLGKSRKPGAAAVRISILTFLQDFCLLGGTAALIVHDGFTYPDHPLLTLHGYIWHILLLVLSFYIFRRGLSDRSLGGFLRILPLFGISAAAAELINVLLHGMGDCDMFYISPYHASSQIVFHDLDGIIGRPAGIFLYLLTVASGGFLVHLLYHCAGKRFPAV